jgi:cell division protein FtsI (penicillin-binding protein 3)
MTGLHTHLTHTLTPKRSKEMLGSHLMLEVSKQRLTLVILVFCLGFCALIVRLLEVSAFSYQPLRTHQTRSHPEFTLSRASITDRNGVPIAINLSMPSTYANLKKMIEPEIAANKLCKALPELKCNDLKERFTKEGNFAWVKRYLTPIEQQVINDLGIPGIEFIKDQKRLYPNGKLFSHVVGYVDIDGNGMAGAERYFNRELAKRSNDSLVLSLDSRIQNVLHDELSKAIELHSALGGAGIIMNAKNGEVLAMVSLPDFDPNLRKISNHEQLFNRNTLGVYEMGSTFKLLTAAMALDAKTTRINDAYHVGAPLKVANFTIKDYRGKGGMLSVPEVLMYSSNIGTAQMIGGLGSKRQKQYLQKMGLFSPLSLESKEISRPIFPNENRWSEISSITISYGHGMAVTPVHLAQSIASIVNGGTKVRPTILKQDSDDYIETERVVSHQTSETMRQLMHLIVQKGYGKKADAGGYFVGGKTGTAEKVSSGRYSKKANVSLFVGAFPIHEPEYVILIMIDEAKTNKANGGFTTGGMIAAPVVKEVVLRAAPLLGIYPKDSSDASIQKKLELNFTPRFKGGA